MITRARRVRLETKGLSESKVTKRAGKVRDPEELHKFLRKSQGGAYSPEGGR